MISKRHDDSKNSTNIVSSNLCDNNVKQHSGYIEIAPGANIFFWFFESRNNPKGSPLTLWLNGGPGCSSLFGLFEELGPCKSNNNGSEITNNIYSWNEISNMLFVDQPVGVGLSYGSRVVNSTEQAAEDLYVFLQIFFAKFPEYATLDFHVFGESYGGHYAPAIAKKIVEANDLIQARTNKETKINLKTVGLGNGWVDAEIQLQSNVYFAEFNSYHPVLDVKYIQEMKNISFECKSKIEKSKSTEEFRKASIECDSIPQEIFDNHSYASVYDIRVSNTSYSSMPSADYVSFLNKPEVLRSIGAESFGNRTFVECSDKVFNYFSETGDGIRSYKPHVEYLLEKNIRVMLYHGDADYICNWFGGLDVTNQLVWKNQREFNAAPMQYWKVDDVIAGQIRKFGNLWFVKVYESGHAVPFHQAKNSLDLLKKWFNDN
ncbi:13992_t:CDS:10 [Acaulospora morrowiae]|uniref:Carboxypeptidase n=1 Tax=Acaulospora morrowiae TaxID=94023 RepID=A0A9N9GVZ1_9GLOM|nr:13992_t:CDS:10 [Acaulospora morrowiae]